MLSDRVPDRLLYYLSSFNCAEYQNVSHICQYLVAELGPIASINSIIVHEGWCVDRCENVRCGLNARCDRANGLCSCLPYFIGNSEVMCVPPVLPPICSPRCGAGAHCVYGVPNYCVCNPTLSGNPYSGCSETTTKRCSSRFCGTNAICSELGVLDCRCPAGLQGKGSKR